MAGVRVGIIGTDNSHAYTYAAFINGWDDAEPVPTRLSNGASAADMYLWAMLLRRLEQDPDGGVPIEGARVTSIWSSDRRDAERIGRACGIAEICDDVESVCDGVDAVMVLSERPETHLRYAASALERGLSTYVDKPLAESPDAGREIFALAERYGARCFTGSSLRWAPEFLSIRESLCSRAGGIRAISVHCPLGLELYGIHAVEIVNLFMGSDVRYVEAVGTGDRQVVLLEYFDGASAVLENLNFVRWPRYSATVYGDSWRHHVTVDDPAPAALAFVRRFIEFVKGGPVPVPASESLRMIDIVTAAQKSLRLRSRVELGP